MKFSHYLLIGMSLSYSVFALSHEVPDDVKADVTISILGDYRYIDSNGIPAIHGEFPNSGNPNTISAQPYRFRAPVAPVLASHDTPVSRGSDSGVALNGVPFDPLSIEYWNDGQRTHQSSPWNYEAMTNASELGLDAQNAHVQPNGAYHYHGLPEALYKQLSEGKTPPDHMILIGYAADGFPMYALYGYSEANNAKSALKLLLPSYSLITGARPADAPAGNYDGTFVEDYAYIASSGDLDECNGRSGVTPEYPQGTYYYMVTNEYPYIPHCYRGTPDPSFSKRKFGPPPHHDN
ncbi:MAG: YHYH protein [Gammaproteobacteria bacterium]|nr:YHYH protein [Gammaproteobacteria bacterium]